MLVLKIEPGQAVTIGPDIVVQFNRQCGRRVSLAISAPKEVAIHRRGTQTGHDPGGQEKRGNVR